MQRYVTRQDKLNYKWKFVIYIKITIFMFHKRCSLPDSGYLDERNEPSYLLIYEHLFVKKYLSKFESEIY